MLEPVLLPGRDANQQRFRAESHCPIVVDLLVSMHARSREREVQQLWRPVRPARPNFALCSPTTESPPRPTDWRSRPDAELRAWAGDPFRAASVLRRRLLAGIDLCSAWSGNHTEQGALAEVDEILRRRRCQCHPDGSEPPVRHEQREQRATPCAQREQRATPCAQRDVRPDRRGGEPSGRREPPRHQPRSDVESPANTGVWKRGLAVFGTRLLGNPLFEIDALDLLTLLGVPLVLASRRCSRPICLPAATAGQSLAALRID